MCSLFSSSPLNGTTTAAAAEVFFIDSQCPQSESDRLFYNAGSNVKSRVVQNVPISSAELPPLYYSYKILLETKMSTNQKEQEPKTARTKKSTNKKQHKPKKAQTKKNTNQKEHKQKTA